MPENTNVSGFENWFDFLKEANVTEKKYKSTNQIPCLFGSGDLLNEDSKQTKPVPDHKIETYSPIFSIEEDQEMEDKVSNSDDIMSEASQESHDQGSQEPKGEYFCIHLPPSCGCLFAFEILNLCLPY